jgi:hypothetical protein
MHLDFDAFLTRLYYSVDLLYKRFFPPSLSCLLSDSEVITLSLISQWLPHRSESRFLNNYRLVLLPYFPQILTQSSFNKRVRKLAHRISFLSVRLHLLEPFPAPLYEIMDGISIPIMNACRGCKTNLFSSEADFGRGGPDRKFYFGVKMQATINLNGYVTGYVVGPASTNELYLAEALLRWRKYPELDAPTAEEMESIIGPSHHTRPRKGPQGPILCSAAGEETSNLCLGDLGLKGKHWQRHWKDTYGVSLLTQNDLKTIDKGRCYRKHFNGERQKIETGYKQAVEELSIRYPKAKSYNGLIARIASKVASFNFMVLLNHMTGRRDFQMASWDPFALLVA